MTTLDYLVLAGLVAAVVHIWAMRQRHPFDSELVYFFTVPVIAFALFCVGIVQFIEFADGSSCRAKADGLDRDHSYGIWSGCLVEADNGDLVPLNNLRFNEDGEVQS